MTPCAASSCAAVGEIGRHGLDAVPEDVVEPVQPPGRLAVDCSLDTGAVEGPELLQAVGVEHPHRPRAVLHADAAVGSQRIEAVPVERSVDRVVVADDPQP